LIALCIALKFYDVGEYLMAYGVVSIVAYLIFLIWVMGSRDTSQDDNIIAFKKGFGELGEFASTMGTAFSIQGFFIPVLKKHTNERRHLLILFVAYVLGICAYYYIAYMGAFGKKINI